MKIKITYPHIADKKWPRKKVIALIRLVFLGIAALCVFLNIVTKTSPWSVIVLWALFTTWSFIIWPDLVEFNRISLWIRLVTSTAVLLNIIAALFSPNAATAGVPIVWFIGVTVSGILFFTDLERQKQNMLPMLLLIFVCIFSSISGLILRGVSWELIVMGVFALALLVACFIVMRNGFVQEVKKRFHTR
ncbi:DUF6320 domain-containing protein [Eubacteriales bacterium OttesenSCG-928-K08]|nr:DUF6320 domain-containing protein [Eubacteriales bacterium OttesenSCG-928-K08]